MGQVSTCSLLLDMLKARSYQFNIHPVMIWIGNVTHQKAHMVMVWSPADGIIESEFQLHQYSIDEYVAK